MAGHFFERDPAQNSPPQFRFHQSRRLDLNAAPLITLLAFVLIDRLKSCDLDRDDALAALVVAPKPGLGGGLEFSSHLNKGAGTIVIVPLVRMFEVGAWEFDFARHLRHDRGPPLFYLEYIIYFFRASDRVAK